MEITAKDVLKILEDKAQWCREEGDADMRYIVHMAQSIREDIDSGMSREEIIKSFED